MDMSKVPFFTEANSEADLKLIDDIARSMSSSVHHADAAHRRRLHIAGVFTSNFTVALLEMAQKVLQDAGYPLEVVWPLMVETIEKAFKIGPYNAMTGPALRGDSKVLSHQSESLDGQLKEAYDVLTEYIIKNHKVELK